MRRILVPRRKRVRRHVSAAKSLRKFAAARFPFDFSSRCEQRESLSIEIRPFHPKNPMPYIYIYRRFGGGGRGGLLGKEFVKGKKKKRDFAFVERRGGKVILTIVFRHETTLDKSVPFHYHFQGPPSCLWMFHTRFYRPRDCLPLTGGDPFNFISPAPPLSCALHPRRREKGARGPRFTTSLRFPALSPPPLLRDTIPRVRGCLGSRGEARKPIIASLNIRASCKREIRRDS